MMERAEAVKLLDEAAARLRKPSRNANGGAVQIGGCFWRLSNVLSYYVEPLLDAEEGVTHAAWLRANHGLVQPVSANAPAIRLAAALQRAECAAHRGHRITGYASHAGASDAYRHALHLLLQEFPNARSAAVTVLDKDSDGHTRSDYRQALTSQAVEGSVKQAGDKFADKLLPPLCQDCRYFREGNFCSHPEVRDPVVGAPMRCCHARGLTSKCRESGRLFAPLVG